MTLNPEICWQRLGKLLKQEIYATQTLSMSMQTEHDALVSRDTDALQQAVDDKRLAVEALIKLEQERTALMESAGYLPTPDGMLSCLDWCDKDGHITELWQQLLALAGDCKEQNSRNYRQVEIGSRYIYQTLCILRGEDPDSGVYGPDGDTGEQHNSRSLIRV